VEKFIGQAAWGHGATGRGPCGLVVAAQRQGAKMNGRSLCAPVDLSILLVPNFDRRRRHSLGICLGVFAFWR
jgi:hypothetical protein